MTRKSYVQIDGVLHEKGSVDRATRGPYIMRDLPSFVSSIDGTVINGRSDLRAHCKQYDVVPAADLQGLPDRMPEVKLDRKARTQDIVNAFNKLGY